MTVGTRVAANTQITFKHIHHSEKGQRKGGLPAACAAADPNLEAEKQEHPVVLGDAQVWEVTALWPWEMYSWRKSQCCDPEVTASPLVLVF